MKTVAWVFLGSCLSLAVVDGCGGTLGPIDTQAPGSSIAEPGGDVPGNPAVTTPSGGNPSGQSPSGTPSGSPPASAACGNSVKEGQEVCDGPSVDCTTLNQGFTGGKAPCKSDCSGYEPSACVGGGNTAADLTPEEAKKQINLERFKGLVTTLASAAYQGRKFGSAGGLKAVELVESKFKEAGLLPGYNNTYRLAVSKGFNTIGVLPGNDPALKNKIVLVGGHHDHLGNSGCLYAGADDNASGASAVMELAFVMAKLRNTIKRTVVFMTFDGEEAGCVGSSAYVKSPVYPLADTVLMLNFDMIDPTRGGYGATGRARSYFAADDSANEYFGAVAPEDLAKMAKWGPEGTYCSEDSDIFSAKGVKIKDWCWCCDETYHECTDTPERMNWTGAIGTVGQGFDALWKAVQG